MQQLLSRLWFLNQGCKQVPLEYTKNIVRWAHPDGNFLNAQGQKVAHSYSPSSRNVRPNMHGRYPRLRECGPDCHLLMALAFYGERPTYSLPLQGKGGERGSYVGIVHHLIPDPLDYKPANLLCWLTREQHRIADNRQKALKTVVPNGDLNGFDYAILRELQDPRTMTDADFQYRLEYLRFMRECDFDPRIFTTADFHHWFSMPFEKFQKFFVKYKDES